MTEIKGWHVVGMFLLGFGIIISVNALLAVQAVRSFPGLETRNSYVVSQQFDDARAAQVALDWRVSAQLSGDVLTLAILRDGVPVEATITQAIFGRATNTAQDQTPEFVFENGVFKASVVAGPGNWNLRVRALAPDGTAFQQRVIVDVAS